MRPLFTTGDRKVVAFALAASRDVSLKQKNWTYLFYFCFVKVEIEARNIVKYQNLFLRPRSQYKSDWTIFDIFTSYERTLNSKASGTCAKCFPRNC